MPLVVGVSFKRAGKVYYFDPNGIELREGDYVIAETARGIEFGEVMIDPKEVPDEEIVSTLKKVVRKATQADVTREETNKQREKNAYSTCQQKIHMHNLPMKLIDAEYGFDGSQVTFYFSAESRVDFRELVKDLAGALRTKVQLHQVGVRDEAKIFGGMGPCGRPMCCATFLNGFEPVSMKMAKEQSLFLNPLKFSGICGKLMCCLKYEYHVYRDAKERFPAAGKLINTPMGTAKVLEVHVIKESVTVQLEDGSVLHYTAEELLSDTPCCAAAGQCDGCLKDAPVETEAETADAPEDSVACEEVGDAVEESAEGEEDESDKPKRRRRRNPRRRRRHTNGEPGGTAGGGQAPA